MPLTHTRACTSPFIPPTHTGLIYYQCNALLECKRSVPIGGHLSITCAYHEQDFCEKNFGTSGSINNWNLEDCSTMNFGSKVLLEDNEDFCLFYFYLSVFVSCFSHDFWRTFTFTHGTGCPEVHYNFDTPLFSDIC